MVESDVRAGIAPTEIEPPVLEEAAARRSTRLEEALNQKEPAQVPLPKE